MACTAAVCGWRGSAGRVVVWHLERDKASVLLICLTGHMYRVYRGADPEVRAIANGQTCPSALLHALTCFSASTV